MFLKISQISQENTCVGVSFWWGLMRFWCRPLKKSLQHRCVPVNIAKFLRTPTLTNICERLLLSWGSNVFGFPFDTAKNCKIYHNELSLNFWKMSQYSWYCYEFPLECAWFSLGRKKNLKTSFSKFLQRS